MALSEKLEKLEDELDQYKQLVDLKLEKLGDELRRWSIQRQELLYNMLYGIGIKTDILQAIILETISSLPEDVKEAILSPMNLSIITKNAEEGLQRRLDMLGDSDNRSTAPLNQLMEDKGHIVDTV